MYTFDTRLDLRFETFDTDYIQLAFYHSPYRKSIHNGVQSLPNKIFYLSRSSRHRFLPSQKEGDGVECSPWNEFYRESQLYLSSLAISDRVNVRGVICPLK